jgi:hypothetical protein
VVFSNRDSRSVALSNPRKQVYIRTPVIRFCQSKVKSRSLCELHSVDSGIFHHKKKKLRIKCLVFKTFGLLSAGSTVNYQPL